MAGRELRWTPAGGGYSGSAVWRGDDAAGTPVLALKQWPEEMPADRLVRIHAWMKQTEHLAFVPRVLSTNDGGTLCEEAGRVWDLTTWMPGRPSGPVEAACIAFAELHRVWRPAVPRSAPPPAVLRRLAILENCQGIPESITRWIEPAKAALRPWLERPLPVQPCLCDGHREHILFTGDTITGIIDYGAMKRDHVAVDLARYLGDACGEDDEAFERGVAAYSSAGGILGTPAKLVRVLDRTGLVCAVIGWARRLAEDSSPSRAVRDRVERLAARLASLRGI